MKKSYRKKIKRNKTKRVKRKKYSKKKYGKGVRFFLMAPLHHHYELKGLNESKIVIRFWIVGILLSLLAIITLKVQ